MSRIEELREAPFADELKPRDHDPFPDLLRMGFSLSANKKGYLVFKLFPAGEYHYFLGALRHGDAEAIRFDLHRKHEPCGDHKWFVRLGGIPSKDFKAWLDIFEKALPALVADIVPGVLSRIQLRSADQLAASGWIPMPELDERGRKILEGDRIVVRNPDAFFKSHLVVPSVPRAFVKPTPEGELDLNAAAVSVPANALALFVHLAHLDDDALNAKLSELPAWAERIIRACLDWLAREAHFTSPGPQYLLMRFDDLAAFCEATWRSWMQSAAQAFDDRGIKEFFRRLRDLPLRAAKGRVVDLRDVLGFDIAELAPPETPDHDCGSDREDRSSSPRP